jgi:hypothetical protein
MENKTNETTVYFHEFTCSVELYGLCIFIRGEKLLLSGTLAPKYGLNLYGLGIPTPKTYNQLHISFELLSECFHHYD